MHSSGITLGSQGSSRALVHAALTSCNPQQQQQQQIGAQAAAFYHAANPAIASIPHWAASVAAPPFPVAPPSIPPPISYRAVPRASYDAGMLHSQGQLSLQAQPRWSTSCVPVVSISSLPSQYHNYQATALQQLTSPAHPSTSSQACGSRKQETTSDMKSSSVDKRRSSHRSRDSALCT
nr:uncharacterized protein LOC119162098 [Rhipicephalus microplus]